VQPVEAIGQVAKRFDSWYILDACQSIGQMKLDVQELHCDFLSVTNRKFLRGPRGAGFLYVSDRALHAGLEPLFIDMRGAEWMKKDQYQQRAGAVRYEDWEFAYALVLATRRAIDYCMAIGEDRIWGRVSALSNYVRERLNDLARVRVLDRGPALGGLVTFTVDSLTPGYIMQETSKRKINVVPSYRNFAVMDFDEKGVEWAIRVSPHYYNTQDELDQFIDLAKEEF
jgi:selenocysteine lyase/cysteine desulfurase